MKKTFFIYILLSFLLPLYGEETFKVKHNFQLESNTLKIEVSFDFPKDHYLYEDKLKMSFEGQESLVVEKESSSHPAKSKKDPFFGKEVSVFDQPFQKTFWLKGFDADAPLEVKVSFQGCNNETCFLPQKMSFPIFKGLKEKVATDLEKFKADFSWVEKKSNYKETYRLVGFENPKDFLEALKNRHLPSSKQNNTEQRGILLTLLFILLGGLALNLTPCVLPMIPLNLAIIGAGTQAGNKKKGFLLGASYGLGITMAYGLLGVFIVLSGKTFGTLNSSPLFNLLIAAIFFLLSAAMYGKINIDLTRFQPQEKAKKNLKGHYLAVFMGSISALLAGACVAPVVLSVLLLANQLYSQGNIAGLFLPFVLGLGMALPWPFAGAGLGVLPRPGAWMDWIKKGFAIFIFGLALYYGSLGVKLWRASFDHSPKEVKSTGKLLWHKDLEKGFEAAAKSNKPIFIDFWASWCKNCLALEKKTFAHPRVQEVLSQYTLIKIQAENPEDPETKKILKQFDVLGLPTALLLEKAGT